MAITIPANTKYFQNIFKRTEQELLETLAIKMCETLEECSITIGKTLMNINNVIQYRYDISKTLTKTKEYFFKY